MKVNTGIANHHAISVLYEMSFRYRSNILYTSRPTGTADNIIVQTIIPFLGYSIPKGVLEMPILENADTGKCRYWKLTVLENAGTPGKCKCSQCQKF